MNKSVFTKAYSYRDHKKTSPLENYTTEIFAHSLFTDNHFSKNFLKSLSILEKVISVRTQPIYEQGRPDLEIFTETKHIMIECKIGAREGPDQLSRYKAIPLHYKCQEKVIVFLTREYEIRNDKDIYLMRWNDIAPMIDRYCAPITQEFLIFLNEKHITMEDDFSALDIITLDTLASSLSKMDEAFAQIEPVFSKYFGKYERGSSWSSKLYDRAYYSSTLQNREIDMYTEIGFFWWWKEWNDNNIYVGLALKFLQEGNADLIQIIKTTLPHWEEDEYKSQIYFGTYKNLHEIIVESNNDQSATIFNFLSKSILELNQIKSIMPTLFKKSVEI